MTPILAIARRELESFFVSFKAYVILTLGLALFTLFFALLLMDGREASMRAMFKIMEFLFITICPILTMGAIAEERRSGTMELLRTAPLGRGSVVAGKYLGTMAVYGLLVASTFHFYAVLEHFGAPDRGPVLTGYAGLLMEGGLLVALGLFASSVTNSQAVAGLLTYVTAFGLYAIALLDAYVPESWSSAVANWGLGTHTSALARGLVQSQDLVYFLSLTLLFLGLAVWRVRTQE